MASSVRRPARVCGSLLSQELRTARVCGDPPREFSSAGREYSKLLSSARAHCWQGFDAHRGRRSRNLCAVLLVHYGLYLRASYAARARAVRLPAPPPLASSSSAVRLASISLPLAKRCGWAPMNRCLPPRGSAN